MKNYSVRTDLALEEKERFASDNVEVQGVVPEEEYDEENEIRLTRVVIETENGAKIMGKPTGIYLTLESPDRHWRWKKIAGYYRNGSVIASGN